MAGTSAADFITDLLLTRYGAAGIVTGSDFVFGKGRSGDVVTLADHARRSDDIEPPVVRETRAKAVASRDTLPENDSRRAYYDNKIAWCDLLLQHAPEE